MATKELTTIHNGVSLKGHLAWDERQQGRRPGVLVIHEAGGLGGHAKQRAERIAQELGYAAYAMDLFGEVPASMPDAMGWITRLLRDPADLRGRLSGALRTLATQPEVHSGKLAAIGFCFGGTAAIELARSGADLKAIVGFHAGLRGTGAPDAAAIKAKILICNGAQDPFMTPEVFAAFTSAMIAAGADWQVNLYGRARHSFTNVDADKLGMDAYAYNGEADRRSWQAMRSLFAEVFDDEAGSAAG